MNMNKENEKKKEKKIYSFLFFKSAQLSVERPNGSRLAAIILVTCASLLLIFGLFALFCFIKRNERIREKFAEIIRIKSQSTNDYRVR